MLLLLPLKIRIPAFLLPCALLLLLTTFSNVCNAQDAKTPRAVKSNWQANLKRIFLFTDIKEENDSRFDYTAEGKFSIRSTASNKVIFSGENLNKKEDNAVTITNHSIFVVDPAGRTQATEEDSVVEVKREINELPKEFSVFPNPIDNTQREITVSLGSFEDGAEIQMSLYDGQGRVLNQQSFTPRENQQSVAIPKLSSGMYFIKINENNKQYSKKLLVK
ncbi:T9SS type A sorting domain-containing protein [Dyadobacter sp. NIV53]|uniref:T9SS type A sorting domain-containing protein n=1 Tax=Dyadobacter sp. NIV53 TaxID=2861765 RepID=UPI001C874475|nr:T9SS type A sorting domain-containing protein [Dyadobacter sp. NIV53]